MKSPLLANKLISPINVHVIVIMVIKEVKVYLNPEVVVITAGGENSTLIKDFTLTYSTIPADALTTNSSLGIVTIDKTFNKATVIKGLSSSQKAATFGMQLDCCNTYN